MRDKKEIKAEKYYNDCLKDIYNMIGNKTTYDSQLSKCAKKLFGHKFKGVYASDMIPRLNDLSKYCILNLDKSNMPGSHWVALAKIEDKDEAIIYDSFGRNYKKIIPSIKFSGNGKIRNADMNDTEQKIKQTDCGARCLAFLKVCEDLGTQYALLI